MRVDLNADVGESFGRWTLGDDEAMLAVVTSANVACGFHAGDPGTLRRVCAIAAERGVAIGAQVSYRDLAGFGRRYMEMPDDELRDDLLYQLGALGAFARLAGAGIAYLKPHGALYTATVRHQAQAREVVDAALEYGITAVLGLPGSALLAAATAAGLRAVPEAFADRGYTAAGTLVPRAQPGALITDPAQAARRAVRMVTDGSVDSVDSVDSVGSVDAVDGTSVAVAPESICVHGDTPGAVALAAAVRTALEAAGVAVSTFADPVVP